MPDLTESETPMESKTKKKVGTTVGSIAVVGAAIALTAGTFSYFSDTQEGHVKVSTGHISLGGNFHQGINAKKVIPGWHESYDITLKNTGNVDGNLNFSVKGGSGDGNLGNALEAKIPGSDWQSLPSFNKSYDAGKLKAGGKKTYTVKLRLPNKNESQNELQGKSVKGTVKAELKTETPKS